MAAGILSGMEGQLGVHAWRWYALHVVARRPLNPLADRHDHERQVVFHRGTALSRFSLLMWLTEPPPHQGAITIVIGILAA